MHEIQSYWDNRPCNIRHSKRDVGTVEYCTEVAQRRYKVEPHILAWLADTPGWLTEHLKVLEIGSGIGTDAFQMAMAKHTVDGFDLSPMSVEVARESARSLGLENAIRFSVCNTELGFNTKYEKYDLIYSYGVLHHTTDPSAVLDHVKQYMHSDSIIKVMVYNKWSWKGINLWLKDRSYTNSEAQRGCPLTKPYSRRELRSLFKDFEILEIKTDFIFPYRVPDYIRHKYVHVWYWPFIKHLQKWFGWHLLLTARLKDV